MDTTTRFFSKLRKLAVTLESETAKLQHSFENRKNNDDDDDDGDSSAEATAKAMRAYHELNCEVGTLKGQIQGQLAQQRAQENEVSNLIKACRVMEQKVTKDIQVLRDHWEKYGYKAPKDSRRAADDKSQESEAEDQVGDENESGEEEEEERGGQEEAGDAHSSSPVKIGPPPVTDVLRTPQLSDFGLSEIQIKRAVAGAKWAEAPPMPRISLPHPSLDTPAPPPMPITPKCALRMDDDELQTPQMNDFGISEDTMFLNNDFTMDLFRKNVQKPQRASEDKPAAPVDSLKESLQTKLPSAEDLESPEPPVFCTPGFKIKKTNGHCTPAAQSSDDPESPDRPGNLAVTPEVPAFKTPYLNRLVSTKKSAQPPEPIAMQADDDGYAFHLPTPPRNGAAGSKRPWEYNVPEISVLGVEDKQMPEMPNLESDLGNSLRSRSAKLQKKTSEREEVTTELPVNSLNLDSPTQDFSVGAAACVRMDYQEPSTPEMPDLSSVTQEICKTQLKKLEAAIAIKKVRPEKHRNSSVSLPVVSESELQRLPSYLKKISLHNLNQFVHNINKFSAEFEGEKTEFQSEELRRISNVGTKTPMYLLCLTELKRLEQVRGDRDTSVYKLITHA